MKRVKKSSDESLSSASASPTLANYVLPVNEDSHKWLCKLCFESPKGKKDPMVKDSNTIRRHFLRVHKEVYQTLYGNLPPLALEKAKYEPKFYLSSKYQTLDQSILDDHITEFIVAEHLSFRIIESPFFRRLLFYLNPNIIVPTRKQLSKILIPNKITVIKNKIKERIKINDSDLTFTSDRWTTNNTEDHYVSLSTHFIDAEFNLHSFFLGAKHTTSQTGLEIANTLRSIADDFEIPSNKMHGFTTDGARNMSSVVEELSTQYGHPINHIWCTCHLLQLILSLTILGRDNNNEFEILSRTIEKARTISKTLKSNLCIWDEYCVKYLYDKHAIETNSCDIGNVDNVFLPKRPKVDIKFNWNSTLRMIKKILEQAPQLIIGSQTVKTRKISYDSRTNQITSLECSAFPELTPSDIEILEILMEILSYFSATIEILTNKKVPSSNLVEQQLNLLQIDLEILQQKYELKKNPELSAFVKQLVLNLKSMFIDKDGSVVNEFMTLASFFDPRLKTLFMNVAKYQIIKEKLFKKLESISVEHMEVGEGEVNEKNTEIKLTNNISSNSSIRAKLAARMNKKIYVINEEGQSKFSLRNRFEKECSMYVPDPENIQICDESIEPLKFWKKQSENLPLLARLARCYLAQIASIDKNEDICSSVGQLVSDNRSRLPPGKNNFKIFYPPFFLTIDWKKIKI